MNSQGSVAKPHESVQQQPFFRNIDNTREKRNENKEHGCEEINIVYENEHNK
jgi:hypothetical protein